MPAIVLSVRRGGGSKAAGGNFFYLEEKGGRKEKGGVINEEHLTFADAGLAVCEGWRSVGTV